MPPMYPSNALWEVWLLSFHGLCQWPITMWNTNPNLIKSQKAIHSLVTHPWRETEDSYVKAAQQGLQTPQVIKYTVMENLLSSDNSVTCSGACETYWLWISYAETTGSDCHSLTWQLMSVSWDTDQVTDLNAALASHRGRKESENSYQLENM